MSNHSWESFVDKALDYLTKVFAFKPLKVWQLQRLETKCKVVSLTRPNRALTEEVVRAVPTQAFANYSASLGQLTAFRALYLNVDSYNRALRRINARLAVNAIIDASTLEAAEVHINLDTFLCTEDKFYIPAEPAITEFCKQALLLCDYLKPSDTQEAGPSEHNLRVLSKHLINIRQIALQLGFATTNL